MSDVDLLQSALAAEHAAVWAYGTLGARLSGADRRTALAALDAHRSRRDRLADAVRDRGAEPVAAGVAYDLPRPVETAADALLLAVLVEERVAAVHADAVAAADPSVRSLAVPALREAAVRAALWRRGSVPFPGLPERARG
jgi:hypothetical protein